MGVSFTFQEGTGKGAPGRQQEPVCHLGGWLVCGQERRPPDDHTVQKVGQSATAGDVGKVGGASVGRSKVSGCRLPRAQVTVGQPGLWGWPLGQDAVEPDTHTCRPTRARLLRTPEHVGQKSGCEPVPRAETPQQCHNRLQSDPSAPHLLGDGGGCPLLPVPTCPRSSSIVKACDSEAQVLGDGLECRLDARPPTLETHIVAEAHVHPAVQHDVLARNGHQKSAPTPHPGQPLYGRTNRRKDSHAPLSHAQ